MGRRTTRIAAPWVIVGMLVATAVPAAAVDYAGAEWQPACTCNYTASNREASYNIRWIVIHTAEGSYAGTISWFKNPSAQASAHFVVAKDGRVAQMVLGKDIAWQAGNWDYNTKSIGIEHEGYAGQASTWTETMYVASAKLTRAMADKYGVPLSHPTGVAPASASSGTGGFIGHNQVPDPNNPSVGGGAGRHTDPGGYFDWNHYMDLVRNNGAPPPPAFQVTIQKPANGAWVAADEVIQGTTNRESELAWMRIFIDNTLVKWVTPSPHAWTWDTRGYGDGTHSIRMEASTTSGTTASATITSKVDNTPPATAASASGTAGANGWWRSAVSVSLGASDAGSGVAATYRSVDGGAFASGTTATVSGDGTHTVRYYSTDKVGNTEATKTLTVRIDTTPPTMGLTSPLAGHAYVNDLDAPAAGLPATVIVGTKTASASASDATSGMDRVEFRVDGAARASDASSPYAWLWPAGQEALGDHNVQARAYDKAGNSASASLTVKTVPTTPEGAQRTADGLLPP